MTDETKDLIRRWDARAAFLNVMADHGMGGPYWNDVSAAAFKAIPAANPAQGDEGWVRVPTVATQEQLVAGREVLKGGVLQIHEAARRIYNAMIAAAPVESYSKELPALNVAVAALTADRRG